MRYVLLVEGAVNLLILVAKASVGFSTGSYALLGDAIHSLADLANNLVALVVVRIASAPPDREHPYGHQRFETLAVFGLAVLLSVLAFEIVLRAFESRERDVVADPTGLLVMLGVLAANVVLTLWERSWARRLDSAILDADARHTFADVLTTVAVIGGWQLAARGYPWLDSALAVVVAALVMMLAYGLFRRAIPRLVDRISHPPEEIVAYVQPVDGVRAVERVRSRWVGSKPAVDVVVKVAPDLPTRQAHEVADAVERTLLEVLSIDDVTVHIEPDESMPGEGD